jgi:hypothetical protein
MMLLKTAFSSLLVLLVGCEHRQPPSENAARPPTIPTAQATSAILALAGALAIGACSPGPVAVSQSPRDPSNPAAPEGAKAPSSSDAPSMAPADKHAHHEHHAHDHGAQGTSSPDAGSADSGSADAVYVCPMHPAVTSSTPGRCPECGMNLVQKK